MEEDIGYDGEEKARTSAQWELDAPSTLSLDEEPTKLYYQHENLQLHLLQKKEIPSERRVIPSSVHERLSYYRTFISSTTKTQIICMQHVQFNRFLWYYITNVIFKSLPHTFVQIFLASYASEEHLFLSKMVPFFKVRTKGMFITAGFFELIGYIDTCILLFDYVICGLLFQNPWNRCKANSYSINNMNRTIHCYNLKEFAEKFRNATVKFESVAYVDANNDYFQLAQIEYYRQRKELWNSYISLIYFTILWLSTGIGHLLVFKKMFWKILNVFQWTVNFVDFAFFIHLTLAYFHEQFGDTTVVEFPLANELGTLWNADVDMLAESTTAPPIVHVLTARSTQEINPSKDSTIIITSNAICFIFRGLLTYKVKRYIENLIGAPLYVTDLNQHSWFYSFPMYFATFYLGNLYTLVFLTLNLIMELMAITVTYHSLIEVIVCEWQWAKRWGVNLFLTILGIVVYLLTTLNRTITSGKSEKELFLQFTNALHDQKFLRRFLCDLKSTSLDFWLMLRVYLYICSKVIAALTEVLVLYFLYPLGRLLDDFTFHYGEPPTKLRIFSLRIVPIFYTIKCYTMLDGLIEVLIKSGFMILIDKYKWLWLILFVPVLLGIFYIVYDYVYKKKKSWQLMFRPDVNWGPRDAPTRQLRKQFDSRVFIGSQSPRPLSRYMIDQGEPNTYCLDLRYDTDDRRSPVVNVTNARFEKEKKRV